MVFAWLSDRYRQRAAFIALQTAFTLAGLCLMAFVSDAGWRYAGRCLLLIDVADMRSLQGIFLANAGSGGCIPGLLAYVSNLFTDR